MQTMDREGLAQPVHVRFIALSRVLSSRFVAAVMAAGMVLLAGSATTVAQDSRMTAVPVAGIGETSWLCALDAADSSARPGRGVNIGVSLCRGSFATGAGDLLPGPPGLGQGGSLSDSALTGADMLTPAALSPAGHVDIPDPGLRRALEQALGKRTDEPISPIDMGRLTSLVARRAGIADLSGLEFAIRLRHLDLYGNAVSDLAPLNGLIGLEMLSLAHNGIRDDALTALSLMTGLEVLSLAGNTLDDLSLLANLSRLRVLDLTATTVDDISPLQVLSQLEGLYLGDNGIGDASALNGLPRLRWLLLTDNAIEDINPLVVLTELDFLDLADNTVEDIFPLVQNPGLAAGDSVVLSGNPLSPVSRDELIPDLRARGVEVLFDGAENTQLRIPDDGLRSAIETALGKDAGDAITADEMAELTELVAESAGIEDLTGLEHAVNLTRLDLSRNSVKDLSPLAGLTALEELNLDSNSVEDIVPLSQLTALKNLGLWRNAVSDLTPLAGLPSLQVLDLGSNAVEDISSLSGLTELEVLSVRNNSVGNLSPLAQLHALRTLYLEGNVIADVSPLAGLTGLSALYLGNNAVEDISPLVENAAFDDGDFVSLTGNPLSDESIDVHIPALEARGVEVEFDADAGGLFSAQRVITTDAVSPVFVHAADLDGDGDPDVLSASAGDDTVAWYENLGNGTFSDLRVISRAADHAISVYATDLDGDGDADVLSASANDSKIAWYENFGDGEFSAQRVITTDAVGAESVHAADLDGDGDPDVLSASSDDDKIAWYENLGEVEDEFSFSAQRVITTDADGAKSVRAADLDGDGDADVLSASWNDDKIAWYENFGDGEFSAQRVITTDADGAESVHAADLDGDGDADVVSAEWGTGAGPNARIAWYENLGGNEFSAPRIVTTDVFGAVSVHSADLDGDGNRDVLYASSNGHRVAWNGNQGGGTFSTQHTVAASPEIGFPHWVHAADLDSDGDSDVLYAAGVDDRDNVIAWHQNQSDHGDDHGDTLSAATLATALPAFLHGTLESGGDVDVFRVATGSGTLRVFSNGPTDMYGGLLDADGTILDEDDDSGTGTNFRIAVEVEAGTHYVAVIGYDDESTGPYTLSIEFVADTEPQFDESGPGDQSHALGADVSLTLPSASGGNGSLTYSLTPEVPGLSFDPVTRQLTGMPTVTGDYAMTYAVTDEDGDVSSFEFTLSVAAAPNEASFSGERIISTAADGARDVHASDLDGDGDLDVLSASSDDDKIAWYENFGAGVFSAQRVISTAGRSAFSVYAADLDGDEDPDVLSASWDDDKIAWYENLGNGTFSGERVISATADGAFSVHATDLDGDGDADVLSASSRDHKIAWYENLGGGTFSPQTVISTAARSARSVFAADLDGDGDPDVLSASRDDHKIAWYENLGDGTFSSQIVISTEARFAVSVYAADLDGDDDADVLSASNDDDKIAFYENLGGGTFSAQRVITTDADFATTVHAVDLDGDGDADVLSASQGDNKIAWYENLGGGTFTEQRVISTAAAGAFTVRTADVDGDGDLDVLSTSGGDDKIAWYENLSGHGDGEVGFVNVAQFLEERPRLAAAMLWAGTDNEPKSYAEWPQTLKGKLDLAVRRQLAGDGSGLPDVMTNQASDVLDDDYGATTVLSREDAEDLYVAHVANSLILEMTGALPWSLDDLSEHELTLLLSGSRVGHPNAVAIGGARNGGFYDGYGNVAGANGYIVRGWVSPAPPEVVHEFMARENLVGDSRYETIIRTIEWARYNLVHFSGGFTLESVEEQWGYRGAPPLARILSPTITKTNYGRERSITAGCHGTNWFLIHLLRVVNIPVEYLSWADHAIPSFPTEGMYLTHGDDPYSGHAQYTPPFPEPFPTSEIPITEATYREWFGETRSNEEKLNNVSRRIAELALEYLPQVLLSFRCHDRVNGVSDNESSLAYRTVYPFWTVAELEAMRFWERMDAKIEQYGGCEIFGF